MGRSIEYYSWLLQEDGEKAREIKESGIFTTPLLGSVFIKSLLEYELGVKGDFSVRKYKTFLDISSINTKEEDIIDVLKKLHIAGYIRKVNGYWVEGW